MFVDFKFSAMKLQVYSYWNPMQNLVFQSFVADISFLTCFLAKHVLSNWCEWGIGRQSFRGIMNDS